MSYPNLALILEPTRVVDSTCDRYSCKPNQSRDASPVHRTQVFEQVSLYVIVCGWGFFRLVRDGARIAPLVRY